MLKKNDSLTIDPKPSQTAWVSYLAWVLLLMLILPVCSILIEFTIRKMAVDPVLIGKWFIFWGLGMRRFMTGVAQVFNPRFMARSLFNSRTLKTFAIIRELGFANISLGVMGIVSLFNAEGRPVTAITGCIFFGLATIKHLRGKPDSNYEIIAVITDLLLFSIILLFLFFTLFFYS